MATPSKKLLRMREQLLLEEDRRAGGAQREEAAKQALAQADSLSSHAARLRQMAAGMLRANAEAQAAAGQPGNQTGVTANQPTARRQPGLPQAGAAPRQALSGQPQAPAFYNKADRMRQWEMLQQDRMAGGNRQAAFPASSGEAAPSAYAVQDQLIQGTQPLPLPEQYAEKVVRYGLAGAVGGGNNPFSFGGYGSNMQADPQMQSAQTAYFNNGADDVSLPHTFPLGSLIASAGASDRGMPFAPGESNYLAKLAASNPMYADLVNDDVAAAGRAGAYANNAMLPLKGEAIALAQNTSYVKNGSNDDKEVSIGEILPKPGQDNKATTPPSPRPTPTPTPQPTPTPTPEPAPTPEPTPAEYLEGTSIALPKLYNLIQAIGKNSKDFSAVTGTSKTFNEVNAADAFLTFSMLAYEGRLIYFTEFADTSEQSSLRYIKKGRFKVKIEDKKTGKIKEEYKTINDSLMTDCKSSVSLCVQASVNSKVFENLTNARRVNQKVSTIFEKTPNNQKGPINSVEDIMKLPNGSAIFVENNPNLHGYDHVFFFFHEITLQNSKGEYETVKNVLIGFGDSDPTPYDTALQKNKKRKEERKKEEPIFIYSENFNYKLQVLNAEIYIPVKAGYDDKEDKPKISWGFMAPMGTEGGK